MDPSYYVRNLTRMIDSLNESFKEAGGTPISFERLRNMTALELISMLMTNGIRFTYDESETDV